jgi:hypothetical protein
VTNAPLEASDPERAAVVRRKVLERLTDLPHHYRALEAATAMFGEGFGRDEFACAAASEDPSVLNRVKAIERGVDQLFNYVVVSARGFGGAERGSAALRSRGDCPYRE